MMAGRLANGELSQTKQAIKWRARKQLRNAAVALETQGGELFIEGEKVMPPKQKTQKPAPDAIGVFTPEPVEIEPEPDNQPYHCNNCRATVHQGDAACGVCEQRLNWAGIG
jgi:hypothetical protein